MLFGDKPFLFDGAFGTYYSRLTGIDRAFERANLDDASTVLRIHREYREAGAAALKTNTFAANTLALGGDLTQVRSIVRAGYELACEAAADKAIVFADIGPIPETDREAAMPEYRALLDEFLACGAKHFLFETFAEQKTPSLLASYIKEKAPDAIVIVSLAVDPDGYSRKGLYYQDIAASLRGRSEIDACGFNCVCGPSHLAALTRKLPTSAKPLSIMPNAGYPANAGGRVVYDDNPDYFTEWMLDIADAGATVLGGCCGTTPRHIEALAKALSAPRPKHTQTITVAVQREEPAAEIPPNPFDGLFTRGKSVIAVEIDPPAHAEWERLSAAGRLLGEAGVDVLTVADSPLARARADSFLCAAKLQRETGLPTLPHLSCRDRNLIGMRAALLGAAIEDIRGVLAVTGDPVPQADRGEVKGVFSLNSYYLMRTIATMNRELLGVRSILIGGALNINAGTFEGELRRAQKKMECGAGLFLTQPAFSRQAIENVKRAREALPGAKLLAGVLPLAGYRNAIFLNNEVAGMDIPQEMVTAFLGKEAAELPAVSIRLAMETIEQLDGWCDGYYLMTPRQKYGLVAELVERIRAREGAR